MKFSMILATDINGAIGFNNDLIIHNKEDMRRFRSVTKNKAVIMGRKTYLSLPHFLPGRFHVIITQNQNLLNNNETQKEHTNGNFKDSPFIYVSSLDEAMKKVVGLSRQLGWTYSDEEAVVIGGGEIYDQAIKESKVSHIYHTIYDYQAENADTFVNISQFDTSRGIWMGELECYIKELDKTAQVGVTFAEYHNRWISCKVTK